MKLSIDSSDNRKTIIKLDNRKFVSTYPSPREQNVLGAIIDALSQSKKSPKDITEIVVHNGPGSFTGLRVGTAIANALSFALNLPVNGKPSGTTIIPRYGKSPHISHPKKTGWQKA